MSLLHRHRAKVHKVSGSIIHVSMDATSTDVNIVVQTLQLLELELLVLLGCFARRILLLLLFPLL